MHFRNVFIFSCLLAASPLYAQYATVKGAGDRIESTSYNDHNRGAGRRLNYLPEGDGLVCVNGENRYTRALYGGHTPWRLETSDRPLFATFVKGDHRNLRFALQTADGAAIPLEEFDRCEARYVPGTRIYRLTDPRLKGATITIAVVADQESETAVWRFTADNLPAGATLLGINSHIRIPKLSRNGDMGADAPGCFDPSEEADAVVQRFSCALPSSGDLYVAVADNTLSQLPDSRLFDRAEAVRRELAGRIVINTPDAFLNPVGGALAVAADGVWGEEEVWLHGAIGWRMPLSGWRASYLGDFLGWHDRARKHFDNYAASQVTDVPCTIPHPAQDSTLALARSVKRWGTPQYSNGYICRNPRRNDQMHHYDMNLCYIDELLWHLNWTGDLEYARKMWPVLTAHLKWEKLNYDPDDDGLYDAYACIWASDALYYSSGAVTHSTAYNYRANSMAAMIAEKIGEDPTPYRREAAKILAALNSTLWLDSEGHWAEYREYLGHKRTHSDAAVWTIYHAIDSDVADPFQAYMATRYVDTHIPHIPVVVSDAESGNSGLESYEALKAEVNSGSYATISTTDWMPYSWSINNVAFAEVMHTALAYFEAGRGAEGYKLLKSSMLDGMYLGESPANFGQISFYDAARGECYRDFGDPLGVASRVVIQGLFGITPDALNRRLTVRPALPQEWPYASLHTADVNFDYSTPDATHSLYTVSHCLQNVDTLEMRVPASWSEVKSLTVNGRETAWHVVSPSITTSTISFTVAAAEGEEQRIEIEWGGAAIASLTGYPAHQVRHYGSMDFAEVTAGQMKWWRAVPTTVDDPQSSEDVLLPTTAADGNSTVATEGNLLPTTAGVVTGDGAAKYQITAVESDVVRRLGLSFDEVDGKRCRMVNMDKAFNSKVTDIFRNQYLSPRSPYTTLQLPVQGIGEWCHPLMTADIDDSGLRAAVKGGAIETSLGIKFRTPAEGPNIAYTSLWDNYPDSIEVKLSGKASHAYLLMAGSTNHMQSRIENAVVRVYYADGTSECLPLVNPYNWSPIEQLYFEDGKAFSRAVTPEQLSNLGYQQGCNGNGKDGNGSGKDGSGSGKDGSGSGKDGSGAISLPSIYRLRLKQGDVSNSFGADPSYTGVNRMVEGGAAQLLDLPLNPKKRLSRLVLETTAPDVVIGIIAASLQK
jgi:hypothetical protein